MLASLAVVHFTLSCPVYDVMSMPVYSMQGATSERDSRIWSLIMSKRCSCYVHPIDSNLSAYLVRAQSHARHKLQQHHDNITNHDISTAVRRANGSRRRRKLSVGRYFALTARALSTLTRTDVPSQAETASKIAHDDPSEADALAAPKETSASSAPIAAAGPRSPATRGPRRRQYGTQSTKLEAVDDPLGPLGAAAPPGGPGSAPPAPPQKEPTAARHSRPAPDASTPSLSGLMDSVDLDGDDEQPRSQAARAPPPVQVPAHAVAPRQTQPSVSVEQAAKPSFAIYVGDPHKVGDLTSSHTEYSVTTKTTSKGYRTPEFTVSRRYRDFLWLYTQLHNNSPGVIIPPPPEKQAVGRFEVDFVESRRAALERMLNKIAAHPVLQHDGDLKLFLESDAFNVDIKNKERKDAGLGESKGMFGSMLSGSSTKFIEHDDVRRRCCILRTR
jgi:sorting nexin-1/2